MSRTSAVTRPPDVVARDIARRDAVLKDVFDLDLLREHGRTTESIARYYRKSRIGYSQVHSEEGAMHMALNPDGVFDKAGYLGQAKLVEERLPEHATAGLELASGNGFNLAYLAERHPQIRFTGVDLVDDQVERANETVKDLGNVRFRVGDFQALDLADASQDIVFVVESFCHALDRTVAFAETRRVLRPGAEFIVIDAWRSAEYPDLAPSIQDAGERVEQAMAVADATTLPQWLQEAEQAGFEVVENLDLTDQIRPNLDRLSRISAKFLNRPRLAKITRLVVSEDLLMNAVAGYLMPLTVEIGAHTYRLLRLRKPA